MNDYYTRREFLKTLAVVTASAAVLPLLAEVTGAAPTSAAVVGDIRDFKPGEWKAVTLSNGSPAFVRRRSGRGTAFQALSALCTHKGCPVAWRPREKQFICPCHGGKFDADGKNIAGPPPAPLPALAVKTVKGVVHVGP